MHANLQEVWIICAAIVFSFMQYEPWQKHHNIDDSAGLTFYLAVG